MTYEQVSVSVENHVLTITLNRPGKRNAFTEVMYSELTSILTDADRDPDVHVALIHGAGEVFSAGADFSDFSDPLRRDDVHPAVEFVPALIRFRKPIIAAVHGIAAGVAATTLLLCDVIMAAEGTRFRYPFVEMGLVPELATTLILPASVGYFRAARMLFEADFLDTQQMFDMGIVTEITPGEELMERARALAERLAQKSPAALCRTKFLLRQSSDELEYRATAEFGELARIISDRKPFEARIQAYVRKALDSAEM